MNIVEKVKKLRNKYDRKKRMAEKAREAATKAELQFTDQLGVIMRQYARGEVSESEFSSLMMLMAEENGESSGKESVAEKEEAGCGAEEKFESSVSDERDNNAAIWKMNEEIKIVPLYHRQQSRYHRRGGARWRRPRSKQVK